MVNNNMVSNNNEFISDNNPATGRPQTVDGITGLSA